MSGPFRVLEDVLHRKADSGRQVDFWLRDDDAVEPTDALEKLLELGEASTIPMALAVIPAFTGERLLSPSSAARRSTSTKLANAPSVNRWSRRNPTDSGARRLPDPPH